eukprot:s5603_g6.t1
MRLRAMDINSVQDGVWEEPTCRCLHKSGCARARKQRGKSLQRCRSSNVMSITLLMVASMHSVPSISSIYEAFVSGLARETPRQVQPRQRPRPNRPSLRSDSPSFRPSPPEGTVALSALPFSPSGLLATLGPFGFFVAGGLCSSFSHVLATPIDVIKTSQQATEEREGRCPGMLNMAMKLVKSHGPQKLLSGVGATFTGYFLHGAFKYGLFEIWKSIFRIHHVVSVAGHISLLCICALLAEMLATVVLCWFGALVPLLMKQCSYTVAKLVTYDVMSDFCSFFVNPVLARVLAAFGAATAATLASQPADTVFTCISVEGGSGECPVPMNGDSFWDDEPPSVWKQMRDATNRLGIAGLFSGWQTRIFQMTLIVTVQLLLYDTIRPRL